MRQVRLPFIFLLGVVLAACAVTSDDVEKWKGTVKGPGKIVAVMVSEKYPLDLRTQAALALVQMERQDVDGVDELQGALQRVDQPARVAIIEGMVEPLEGILKGADDAAPVDENAPPDPLQVRAKDAAYLLIRDASPEHRQRLMQAVVGWYVADFNGRSLAGAYSAEQVIRSLGTPAASLLVDALDSRIAPQALVKLAELIDQLGNEEAKSKAATKLVAIEQEFESEAFLDWLTARISEQIKSQQPDKEVDADRVRAAAELNRATFIADGALPAMRQLSEYDVVGQRLLAIAATEAPASDEIMTERRARALAALAGNAKKAQLSGLLDLALDESNPPNVRDQAFERIGEIGSPDALPRLWPLVSSGDVEALRWRAGELVLLLGGNAVVDDFFERLPGDDAKYGPGELEGYATRMASMNPAPTATVRAELAAPEWWNRVIALKYFERKGTASDAAQMERLRGDSTPTVGTGWSDEQKTVGKVAEASITGLRERLENPDEETSDDES